MADLITRPHLAEHDAFYARMLAAHKGLTEPESHALNARLVLILANHIGDLAALTAALDLASGVSPSPKNPGGRR